jgi:N-acetylglucosamine kinase-like BadF-type ATPase
VKALFLGVDMGGTATRWAAVDATGALLARGSAPGASGLIFDAASTQAFAAALTAIRDALPGPVARAHLGITGAGFARHPGIEAQLVAVFARPAEIFSYSNDMELAWHAAFPAGGGHLVSAGTGSIGLSVDPSGKVTVVGGRGILVDDGGSGTWIALRALDQVYRLIDEAGAPVGAETLARRLFAAMGGDDYAAMRAFVYGSDRGRIGQLAVAVAEAARDGDPLATRILSDAVQELARLARALLRRCGPAPVGFIGGVIGLHPAIRAGLEHEFPAQTLLFPKIDAALQAARMAQRGNAAFG